MTVTGLSAQQAIETSGLYQGENLLVVNETNPDGVGFCCYEVRVNGLVTGDQVNSHAFEIDLRSHIALGRGCRALAAPSGLCTAGPQPRGDCTVPRFELISFDADDSGDG